MIKIIALYIIFTLYSFPQAGSSGVPFLTISPSGEANGMGGIMSSTLPSGPSAMIFNPAHLGFLSKTNMMSIEFYTQIPQWSSGFSNNRMSTFNSYSVMYGHQFSHVTIGLGYSRILWDLGNLTLTNGSSPSDVKTFHLYETSDNFSFGIGFQYGIIDGGLGVTIKQITSRFPGNDATNRLREYIAKPNATDIGLIVNIPLVNLFIDANKSNAFFPFSDVRFAYALNNFGENIYYTDVSQSDPLPRTVRLGWSAELGYRYIGEKGQFTIGSIMIAREADELMFKRRNDGSPYFETLPLSDMNIYKSLIEGKYYDYVGIRKGFGVSFLETVTIRSGSYQFDDAGFYSTDGITVSTNGIFKLLKSFTEANKTTLVTFIFNHIEIRYCHSKYSGPQQIYGGSDFNNITLTVLH